MRDQVQLVELPLRPAHIALGTAVEALLERPINRLDAFHDFGETTSGKRQALLDILRGEQTCAVVNSEQLPLLLCAGSKVLAFIRLGVILNHMRISASMACHT